ncbi:MAG: trypsin-like peptidase domain-containing protein [Chthoniobacteraceae bacterium]
MRTHPLLLTLLAALAFCSSAFGVAEISTSSTTYNTTEPTTVTSSSRGPWTSGTLDFSSGWGTSNDSEGITGWDYVGSINSCSFIYLGNGWIITAAHVVSGTSYSGTFTLSGSTYTIVSGTIVYIGDSDLAMIYVGDSATIDLPTLSLSSSSVSTNSTVVLVGNGGGSESWGTATVYTTGTSITLSGYTSTDFVATSGSTAVITGDSGGAAFYYDSTTGSWVLAGVLEATGSSTKNGTTTYYSYIIDISEYATEIEEVMASAVPEPSTLAMAGAGLGVLWWARRRRKNRAA